MTAANAEARRVLTWLQHFHASVAAQVSNPSAPRICDAAATLIAAIQVQAADAERAAAFAVAERPE